jgi:adenosylcobinamide-GDP ribazoletransferase
MFSGENMPKALETALGFLTIFKTRGGPTADFAEVGRSAWAFPLVGALIGVLLVIAHVIFSRHLPPVVAGILTVGLWIILTGGLHLDGWTDCWDALAASVPPERRFIIMKDSRLGTFAAVALILLIAVKTAAVASQDLPIAGLFLAPVVGRSIMVLAAYGARHRGEGMGAVFLSGLDPGTVGWAAIIGLAPTIIAGWTGIFAAAGAYLGALWFRRFADSRLQTINGDVLGAICEFSETLFLLIACARW